MCRNQRPYSKGFGRGTSPASAAVRGGNAEVGGEAEEDDTPAERGAEKVSGSSVGEDRGGGVEDDVGDVVVGVSPTKLAGNDPAIAPCNNKMERRGTKTS